MAGRKIKRTVLAHNTQQVYMKLVTSDVCVACKAQCPRGIAYMRRMEVPGAVGMGVPCRLKAYRK